ncbi:hypothetical protein V1283_003153 [Bradyrhizobium sp. AZCC 2262]
MVLYVERARVPFSLAGRKPCGLSRVGLLHSPFVEQYSSGLENPFS